MRTRASGLLLSVALLVFACSDSAPVAPPAAVPPSSDGVPIAGADDPRPVEPERPAAEANVSRSLEPRRLALEVQPRDDSALEMADPIARRIDDAMARGDDVALEEAMMELEESGGARAIAALGAVVENHPDTDIRLDALELIAVTSEDGSVPPAVVAALGDPDPDVRMEAIDLIVDSGDLSLLSVLESYAASEREEDVRGVYDDAIEDLRDIRYGD